MYTPVSGAGVHPAGYALLNNLKSILHSIQQIESFVGNVLTILTIPADALESSSGLPEGSFSKVHGDKRRDSKCGGLVRNRRISVRLLVLLLQRPRPSPVSHSRSPRFWRIICSFCYASGFISGICRSTSIQAGSGYPDPAFQSSVLRNFKRLIPRNRTISVESTPT